MNDNFDLRLVLSERARKRGRPSDCLGFGFAFSTALAIVSLGRLLTYVRANTAQKAQSAAEDETAPPFEVLPQPFVL